MSTVLGDLSHPTQPQSAEGLVLPRAAARAFPLIGLCAFAGVRWMGMLSPGAPVRAWQALGIACGLAAILLGLGRVARPAVRVGGAVLALTAALAGALLAAGMADEFLRPDRWGTVLAGLLRGVEALPGTRVPFRGSDDWTRTTLAFGATGLVVLTAALAFWPRAGGRLGFRSASAVTVVVLYAVPSVALGLGADPVGGAVLLVSLLALTRLERLPLSDLPVAAIVVVAAVIAGVIAAPALDRGAPWWDYESWALETTTVRTTTFSWDHQYGPLDWPRDGRELLRVKARRPAYWKAENLDVFDGARWLQGAVPDAPQDQVPKSALESPNVAARARQRIQVTVRNLRSSQVITAGMPLKVESGPRSVQTSPGTYETTRRPLRRGDSYTAQVYTPDPTAAQMRSAGTSYARWLANYRTLTLPAPPRRDGGNSFQFAAFASRSAPGLDLGVTGGDAKARLEASELSRSWALARRLSRDASSPYAYVEAIEGYLEGVEFTYTETPPDSALTLDGFLFDAKTGYCQQYSGAMAMLLRMGGVPARVASGFTSGSRDEKTKEFVVRDFDAHSWVEAWFPGYGWVTFDPTPAAAPSRSETADTAGAAPVGGEGNAGVTDRSSERATPSAQPVDAKGFPWSAILVGLGGMAGAGLAGLRVRRRRSPGGHAARGGGELAELERALRRMGNPVTGSLTLSELERRLAAVPGAAAYVQALSAARFGRSTAAPTAQQRRALRAALARDGGRFGRLRGLWALPPRVALVSRHSAPRHPTKHAHDPA